MFIKIYFQELKERLCELDKLSSILAASDKDDFDLRVCPAKAKLKAAIEHFLETSCSGATSDTGLSTHQLSPPTMHRSHKAKDLISYLPDTPESDSSLNNIDGKTIFEITVQN